MGEHIDVTTIAEASDSASHKHDSRREIIEAAAQCFMLKGLDKATMDDIADELGATKGRVYHHFRSKNAIFFAVYRQAMKYCFEAVTPLVSMKKSNVKKLEQMAHAHARVMMDTLPYQRSIRLGVEVYLRGSTTEAELGVLRELITLRNDYENLYREVLRAGVAEGELAVPSIEIASRALMGALNGLVDWYRIRPDQSEAERDALARALAHAVVHGPTA